LDIDYLSGKGQDQVKYSIYQTKLYRDNFKVNHDRMIYGLIDLLGDLGGVLEIVLLVTGFFLNNIAEHSFYTNSISKLYMANTKDTKMFGAAKIK
jgi:hypothetical protein